MHTWFKRELAVWYISFILGLPFCSTLRCAVTYFSQFTLFFSGLYFVGQLGRSDDGRNALLDYQDGIIKEHSIGFNYVKGKIEKAEDSQHGEYYEVKEVNFLKVLLLL